MLVARDEERVTFHEDVSSSTGHPPTFVLDF